ncbi:hypothetical protein [Catellatospora sp. NPDC049609]|uniref:hypothetical protein n=1 Tax=Catellatospora sp. NPDC049609 TaxID=3155505 RepID=UPI003430F9B7
MRGQLDLFTSEAAELPAPAPPAQRAALPPLEAGQVRYRTFAGQRDCDDCWSAQSAAATERRPVPLRRRATSLRETTTGKTHLCKPHEIDRQASDGAR